MPVKTLIVLIAAAFGILLLWAASAHSQNIMCGAYADFKATIEGSRYGEKSLGKGLSGNGAVVIELFVSPETFTILATGTSGRTCIIAAGKKWMDFPKQISGDET